MSKTEFIVPIFIEKTQQEQVDADDVSAALEKLQERLEKAAARRSEILQEKRTVRKRALERVHSSESPTKTTALRRAERNAVLELRQTAAAAIREQKAILLAGAARHLALKREQRRLSALENRERIVQGFRDDCSHHINSLGNTGILDANSSAIEKMMMSDPVHCTHCTKKEDLRKRMCPKSNEPHFRTLVAISKKILEGVTETHASLKHNVIIDPETPPSGPADLRSTKPHPSLLIRAIHAASCAPIEVGDEELRLAAVDVTHGLRQMRRMSQPVEECDGEHRRDSSKVLHAFLQFHRGWSRWVFVMHDPARANQGAQAREALINRLMDTILQLEAAQATRSTAMECNADRPARTAAQEKILSQKRELLTGAIDTQIRQLLAELRAAGGDAALRELGLRRDRLQATAAHPVE